MKKYIFYKALAAFSSIWFISACPGEIEIGQAPKEPGRRHLIEDPIRRAEEQRQQEEEAGRRRKASEQEEVERERKALEQRQQQEEVERIRKASEQRKQQEENELARKALEQRRQKEEAEHKRKASEQHKLEEEIRLHKAEEQRQQQEEAERKRKADEQRKEQEEAERKRRAEEQRKEQEEEVERARKAEEQKRLENETKKWAEEQKNRIGREQKKIIADATVNPDDFLLNYSINLMWLYKEKNLQEYVFANKHRDIILIDAIRGWAEKNPRSPIVLWYDSSFTTEAQEQNTANLFQKWNKELSRTELNAISLKDVRNIPDVNANEVIFSNKTPLYFRADLLRIMATLYTVKTCVQCYFIYSDWDVKPMNKKELLDEDTLKKLNKFGMVLQQRGHNHDMENSFHIVKSDKPAIIKALTTAIVNLNIERAKNALNDTFLTYERPKTDALKQIIYDSIPAAFQYLYQLLGFGEILNKSGAKYSEDTDKLDPFSTLGLNAMGVIFPWNFKIIDNSIISEKQFGIEQMIIPTKPADAPPPSLDY